MKLQKRNNKKIVLLIILAVVVLAAIVSGVVAIISNINEKKELEAGKEIQQIIMSSYPDKMVYYVGESFNPTGAKIQVITKGQSETYFVDYNKLSFEGFDSSEVNDAVEIKVSYKGYSTTFTVRVIDFPSSTPVLERIEVYNFTTSYPKSEWNMYGPNSAGARIRCIYSDGSVIEDIVLKDKYIYGVTESDVGTTEITIKYSDGVTTVETTVEITVTN